MDYSVMMRAALSRYMSPLRSATITCLGETGSTNDDLMALAKRGAPEGSAVIADRQTSGKGRRGRGFHSPAGKGIYMSYLLRPDCPGDTLRMVTAWAAVAARRAIAASTGVSPGIKWVNDLVLNSRKLAGILSESAIMGRGAFAVIGVGINVNHTEADFTPEIRETATSLALSIGHEVSRAAVAAALIAELDALSRAFPVGLDGYLEEYRAACVTVGREVKLISPSGERPATANGIDRDFALLVAYPDGKTGRVASGEASVRGVHGYV